MEFLLNSEVKVRNRKDVKPVIDLIKNLGVMKLNLVFSLTFLAIFCMGSCISGRPKRSLIFNKGSKFFVRINTKEDLLRNNKIFAHAVGYGMSWNLPDKVERGRKIYRRDLYHGIETLLTRNEINGRICMKKFVCEARLKLRYYNDFLSRLVRLIFTPDRNDNGHYVSHKNCGEELDDCPVSLLSFIDAY